MGATYQAPIRTQAPPPECGKPGRHPYVTNSLDSTWDNQCYPDLRGWRLKLDAGDDGLRVDPDLFVDLHPARAREVHLPGGDPTTEIFS
jgi:methanethiol oxidase